MKKIPDEKSTLFYELISGEPYEVKSQVKNETFEAYIEYWKEGIEPKITYDNIWEFYQLNEEFGLLEDHIFSSSNMQFLPSCLNNSTRNSNFDISKIERHISLNLDIYLSKHADKLSQIDINILYNIFYHKERKLKQVDKACEFILNSAKNGKQNVFILLQSLDAKLFKDKKKLKELFFKKNEYYGFAPMNTEETVYNYLNERVGQLESSQMFSESIITNLKYDLNASKIQNSTLISEKNNLENQNRTLKFELDASKDKIRQLMMELDVIKAKNIVNQI